MTSGAASEVETVTERRPAEVAPTSEGRERLLRRGEEKSTTSERNAKVSEGSGESGGESGPSSTSSPQKSQLPTRVRQLTSQLSQSAPSAGAATLPRAGRETERISQRRAVSGSTFLLRDSARGSRLPRRPASAADVDRAQMDPSAPPTAAVSTPSLSTASVTATPRPGSALRSSSRADSLPRKQSRVTILTEEEKRRRELGWNSPQSQNRSKSLPRLTRPTPTTRKSSAPVVERLTRPPPLRKARSFAASQPTIDEAAEGEISPLRAASASGRKPAASGAKAQSGVRKLTPTSGKSSGDTTKTVASTTGRASVSGKSSFTGTSSPGFRLKSPSSRVTSPDARVTSPDSRITSPDSRVTSPDSRMTSPISRNTSPGTQSLPASYRKRSRCSPIPDVETHTGCSRRTSQPKFSDPSQFRPPSSLAKLSVTAKTPPPSFSRAAIPKEEATDVPNPRKDSMVKQGENSDQDVDSEHPTNHNDSGVMVGLDAKKQDEMIQEEAVCRKFSMNDVTVKRVEFSASGTTPKCVKKTSETQSLSEMKSVSPAVTRDKLPLTADIPSPSSNLPSPDSHDLSHATSASEETGYVSSASHSPQSRSTSGSRARSTSGSRASGMTSAGLVLQYGTESTADKSKLSRREGSHAADEQSSSRKTEADLAPIVGHRKESKDVIVQHHIDAQDVFERRAYNTSSLYDLDRRGRTPQRSFHGPPRAGASSVMLERIRRSSTTPDGLGGSLDRRRSTLSPSSEAAELTYLRDTLLGEEGDRREVSPDRYMSAVTRLLRLSRRSPGFQLMKPHVQALQRLIETGAPSAERRAQADEHVRVLLEQLERQREEPELQGALDRSRASGRWSGDVGLKFRGRSVEDLRRMFAAGQTPMSRSEPRSQSTSQSRRSSVSSSLTQSQVGRLRQQLQQLHSADSPRRDVTSPRRDVISPTSSRSGFSVDVTDLRGLSNVLPVRPPPPQPPVRSHASYAMTSRSKTRPSTSSTASSQPPAADDRHRLVERSERLRRQREERIGRPLGPASSVSGPPADSSPPRAVPPRAAPPSAGLSPHLPNQVQKPPRVRDIDDGFRSLPSSSRLRRQRAMASAQYVPQRTVSEQLALAAEAADGEDGGLSDGAEAGNGAGAPMRPIPAQQRREARETSHRASAPPSLAWEVTDSRRKPLPTPRSLEEAGSDAQVECKHLPEPDQQQRRRRSVKKLLLSGFSSLRRKWRSRSGSRRRKAEHVVVVKLSENGATPSAESSRQSTTSGTDPSPPAVETKVMKVDAATSTASSETSVKRTVGSPHRVRTVGHITTSASAAAAAGGRSGGPSATRSGRSGPGASSSRRPAPEVSLIGQMFTSSPDLAEVESLSRVWRQTGAVALRDEFRPVSNFSARTASAAGSSVVASTPVPPSESSDFSAVWRGPAEMDWSIHRPVGRYVPGEDALGRYVPDSAAGGGGGGGGGGVVVGGGGVVAYRSLPRPRARRHPPPPPTGSLPRPVPRRTPCPCCAPQASGGHETRRLERGAARGDGVSDSVSGAPRYQEAAVNIHYRSPVRWEEKEPLSEDELRRRQEDNMRRVYEEARRRREERQAEDRESRRHGDNFTPSQKSPIALDRYERLFDDVTDDRRPTLTASVLHEFRAQNNRELSLSRGDAVRIRRKIDANWYEGQKGTRIGIFPVSYVQVTEPRERSADRWSSKQQVRARHRFSAQSNMELSLNKGDLVTVLRRVDDNWYEGRRGDVTGIFPASYVEPVTAQHGGDGVSVRQKPVGAPAAHGLVMDGLPRRDGGERDQLRVEVQHNTMPYRVMFPYRHQNEDELDLEEGDVIHVLEQCPDGWYVGTNLRTGMFGTFPGNYTRRM